MVVAKTQFKHPDGSRPFMIVVAKRQIVRGTKLLEEPVSAAANLGAELRDGRSLAPNGGSAVAERGSPTTG